MRLRTSASIIGLPDSRAALGLHGYLLNRVRAEYREMPGLCLTFPQAQRLWSLDPGTCSAVLGILVEEGYLRESRAGYLRASCESR
jgi:hypothetical protein